MKKINNYQDLLMERRQLEQAIIIYRTNLKNNFVAIKESLRPKSLIKDMIGIEDKEGVVGPLAGAGINAGIDMVVKNNLLAKTGFVVRTVVPFLLKSVVNLFAAKRNKSEN